MKLFFSAIAAVQQMFSRPFRSVLWKTLGLTLGVLVLAWIGLDKALVPLIANPAYFPWPWVATALSIALGMGLFLGLAFLVAPASSLVAGFFLDDLAEKVENQIYPIGARGRALPAGQAVWLAARFALVSALVNFIALAFFLIPGVNAIVFFVANAYLLGREYFELAALRYRPIEEVRMLRRKHATTLFFAGFFIAAFVAVPILNLLTPLFGVAFMVRVHKWLAPPAALEVIARYGEGPVLDLQAENFERRP